MDAPEIAVFDQTAVGGRADSTDLALTRVLEELIAGGPEGWEVHVDETWAHARNVADPPRQGWKLHVSSTIASVEDVLRACVPVLLEAGCQFKVARDHVQVEWLTHPNCPRENAGKVMTVYPADDEQAVAVAERLDAVTHGMAGPRVLSDRCLRPGSLVHYRYGVFSGVTHVSHDGEVSKALTAPDHSLSVDSRQAGVVAPPWARDPFVHELPSKAPTRVLLGGRYAVREAIRHANRGGVFRGTDTVTGRGVVVKQARAHVGADGRGVDVRDRLRNEAEVLRRLATTGVVPELVGMFEQDGDLFVAEEDLGGSSLRTWVTSGMADGVVCRPWSETALVMRHLVAAVRLAHSYGAVLRDLSPNNVIVTEELRPVLIDLEFATFPEQSDLGTRSGTPAYSAPEQFAGAAPTASADSYSLGAVLLYAFTGEDPYLGAGGPDTVTGWLDHGLRRRLVPPSVADLALALCAEAPHQRATVGTAAMVLSSNLPSRPALTSTEAVDLTFEDVAPIRDDDLEIAIGSLVSRLLVDVRVEPGRVARRSTFGETTLAANVQHGAAGVLGVLVQAWRTLGGDALELMVDDVATWMDRTLDGGNLQGPVGLYFGWAGPCWALAEAGVALGDEARVERAVQHALALPADWPGPDVTHGVAGLGLTLVRLWQLTDDARLRDAVDGVARHLVDHVGRDAGLVSWRTPGSARSSFAGSSFYGFAHGTAGIATFLDHAAAVTGRSEYTKVADAAAHTLRRSALHADGVARWGSGPSQPGPALPHWCNGSSGIATFLARRGPAAEDLDLLDRAARATVAAKWHSGVAYCHGLSGNADFLLDLEEISEGPYQLWAADLLRVMWDRRTSDDLATGLTDEVGRITPDFNVGYGGALSALLRLRYGGSRLWLPEVAL